MQLADFKDTVRGELNSFAWGQWAQLGVFAPSDRRDRAAADPEALLLFTLEVGRDDPRLFDEVLDWLLTNQALISVQRLRNLCVDRDDGALVEGALGWVARWPPRATFRKTAPTPGEQVTSEPLFRTTTGQVSNPDPAFAAVGLIKPDTEPSKKSRQPDALAPIAFAFRMRLLFGVGSRAEVVRYLFLKSAGDTTAQAVAEAAGFAKRNVSETLAALVSSGVVTSYELGNERRYNLNLLGWSDLLGLKQETWPIHRDWLQLLRALRRLSRWLADPQLEKLTPYMLASQARDLAAGIEADLNIAGIPFGVAGAPGEQYWDTFVEAMQRALASLNTWWG